MNFVQHFGHPEVCETSVWTACFQILAKTLSLSIGRVKVCNVIGWMWLTRHQATLFACQTYRFLHYGDKSSPNSCLGKQKLSVSSLSEGKARLAYRLKPNSLSLSCSCFYPDDLKLMEISLLLSYGKFKEYFSEKVCFAVLNLKNNFPYILSCYITFEGSKLSFFSREPNCIFKSYLKETSTSLGSLEKFKGASGEFTGPWAPGTP